MDSKSSQMPTKVVGSNQYKDKEHDYAVPCLHYWRYCATGEDEANTNTIGRSIAEFKHDKSIVHPLHTFTPIHIRPSRERRPIVKVLLNLKLIVPAQPSSRRFSLRVAESDTCRCEPHRAGNLKFVNRRRQKEPTWQCQSNGSPVPMDC
jgi:hypothetical protein